MASHGRGCRGRPRGASQASPVFDQQAFAEAVEIAAAAIAQASTTGSQGGPSNLQRFRSHHPPTFTWREIRWWQIIGAGGEGVGGYGDYLRHDHDQTSCILARG